MTKPCLHYTYTKGQVAAYLDYIQFPVQHREILSAGQHGQANTLKFLTILHKHQLSTVPFENLALHYSTDHAISLDPEVLFEKIVTKKRGGYCMENNSFFGNMLRSVGFQTYCAGGRIRVPGDDSNPKGDYLGWCYNLCHALNIVKCDDGCKYTVDVGLGADGPTLPLPLQAGPAFLNYPPHEEMRLVFDDTAPERKMWMYQIRRDPSDDWSIIYCFTEHEFLPQDFEVMNFYTSKHPSSFFTQHVVAMKPVFEGQNQKLTLVDHEVKASRNGKMELIEVCATEDERLKALKTYFNIELDESERQGIRGSARALPLV